MGVCVCVFVELVCSKANMIYVNTQLSVRRYISSVSLATYGTHRLWFGEAGVAAQ